VAYGDYTARFDAQTQDGESINCMTPDFYMDYAESKRTGVGHR
jgi:hypothetical protein